MDQPGLRHRRPPGDWSRGRASAKPACAGSTGHAGGLRTGSRGVYAHGADDQPDVDV